MIHCFGDSHSSIFSGYANMIEVWPENSQNCLPHFKAYRIGPATAYNIHRKTPIFEEIIRLHVNLESDTLLFCFGEIDIRAHFIKESIKQNLSVFDIARECANRYWSVVEQYHNRGFKVAIWAPIATWSDKKKYLGPTLGTHHDRNLLTAYFTKYLKLKSENSDIKVLSILDKMIENGETNPDLLDDWEGCHIHLNLRAIPLILDEFKKHNLIYGV